MKMQARFGRAWDPKVRDW